MEPYLYGPLIKAINTEIQKHINKHLASAPKDLPLLTGPQMRVLSYLYNHPNTIVYQRDLETTFNLSRPTINGFIKRLRDSGMILVQATPEDKRYKQILLTPEAQTQMKKALPGFDRDIVLLESQMTKGLSKQEAESLQQLLLKVLDNLKELD